MDIDKNKNKKMIERWILWSASLRVCKGGECIGTRKIRRFGQGKKMVSSLRPLLDFRSKKYSFFSNRCNLEFLGAVKGGFFAWEATWAKVLTLDHLRRRGWFLSNRCFLCHLEKQSIDHIFIHCVKTRIL